MWGVIIGLILVVSVITSILYFTGKLDKFLQKDIDIYKKGEAAYAKALLNGEKVGVAAVEHRKAMKSAYIQKYPSETNVDEKVEEILIRFMPTDQLTNFLRAEYEQLLSEGKDAKPPVYPFPSGEGGGSGASTAGTGVGTLNESCNKVGDKVCNAGLVCGSSGTCVTASSSTGTGTSGTGTSGTGTSGTECTSNSDCNNSFNCINNKCVYVDSTSSQPQTGGGKLGESCGRNTSTVVDAPCNTGLLCNPSTLKCVTNPETSGTSNTTPANVGTTPAIKKVGETCSKDNDCESDLGCLYEICTKKGDGTNKAKCNRRNNKGVLFDKECSGGLVCFNDSCTKPGNGQYKDSCNRPIDKECAKTQGLDCINGLCEVIATPGDGTTLSNCNRTYVNDAPCKAPLKCTTTTLSVAGGRCEAPYQAPGIYTDTSCPPGILRSGAAGEWKKKDDSSCNSTYSPSIFFDENKARLECAQNFVADGNNYLCTKKAPTSGAVGAVAVGSATIQPITTSSPAPVQTTQIKSKNCYWDKTLIDNTSRASNTSTCYEATAKSDCQAAGGEWISLDYSKNRYTCKGGNLDGAGVANTIIATKQNGVSCSTNGECASNYCTPFKLCAPKPQ